MRPQSYVRGSLEDRFWPKVDRRGADECWPWLAGHYPYGYGCIYLATKKRMEPAHRASWMIHFGPIPNRMHVLHKCDNPECVNPRHLFLGTNNDNVQDKMRKGRLDPRDGENNGRSILTKDQVVEIRELYAMGDLTQQELGEYYDVHQTQISRIVRHQHWQETGE